MSDLTVKIRDGEEKPDFEKMAKECFVDLTKPMKRQPIALSIGSYESKGKKWPIPFGSYGDFSCLVGASKSKKTFLKTALVASYIGGNAQSYFPIVKSYNTEGKYVIDVDTEQSIFHTQKAARRAAEMVGANPNFYKPFAMRKQTPKERFQFVEWLIMESEYSGKIGLITVDGAADLLENTNDLQTSNEIVSGMMKWTKSTNCHLLTVLHRTKDGLRPTGHLGSAITKKAETVAHVKIVNENDVEVEPEYTRNYPFEKFTFFLDENNLPTMDNDTDEIEF